MGIRRPKIGLGLGISGRTEIAPLPVFDPLTLSPYMWNRADSVTKDASDYISAFDDLAGNGNFLRQTVANEQPQQQISVPGFPADIPGAKFDGIDDDVFSTNVLLSAQTKWEIYTVWRTDLDTTDLWRINASNQWRAYRQANQQKARIRNGVGSFANYVLSNAVTPGNLVLRDAITNDGITDGVSHRDNLDTEKFVPVAGFFSNFGGNMDIGNTGAVGTRFDGWFMEMLLFHRHLTPDERNNLNSYFSSRYATF